MADAPIRHDSPEPVAPHTPGAVRLTTPDGKTLWVRLAPLERATPEELSLRTRTL